MSVSNHPEGTGSKPNPDDYHSVLLFRSFVDKLDCKAIEPVFENNYIAEGLFAKRFHDELAFVCRLGSDCPTSNLSMRPTRCWNHLVFKSSPDTSILNDLPVILTP